MLKRIKPLQGALPYFIAGLAIITVWQIVVFLLQPSPAILPSPFKTANTLWELIQSGELFIHISASLTEKSSKKWRITGQATGRAVLIAACQRCSNGLPVFPSREWTGQCRYAPGRMSNKFTWLHASNTAADHRRHCLFCSSACVRLQAKLHFHNACIKPGFFIGPYCSCV